MAEVDEGALRVAEGLFWSLLGWYADREGTVRFMNERAALRAAISAYLIATGPVEPAGIGYAYIRVPADPEPRPDDESSD